MSDAHTPDPAMKGASLGRKVVSGLFWSSVQNWSTRIVTLIVFAVFARLLSPEDMGVFSAAMAVLAFIQLFSEQGLSGAIVQRKEINAGLLNAAAAVNFGLSLLIMIALFLGAPLIAERLAMPALVDVLRLLGLNLLLAALGFSQRAMHRRNFNYRWLAACSFFSTFAGAIVGIGAALAGAGIWSLVAQALVTIGIESFMLWMRPQWRFGLRIERRGLPALLGFGAQRLGANLLDFANTRYVEIYVAASLGASALGVYAVGIKIYQALMQVMNAVVFSVALGAFSRLAHDRPALLDAYYRSMASTAALVVPAFVLLSALAPEVVLTLFGDKWASSAFVLQLAGAIGALQALQYQNGVVFNAIGRPALVLYFLSFRTVVTFVALWLSGGDSLERTVLYYMLAQCVVFVPNFVLARLVLALDLRLLMAKVGPFLVASMVAWGAVWQLRIWLHATTFSSLWRTSCLVLVGVATYALLAAIAGRVELREIRRSLSAARAG